MSVNPECRDGKHASVSGDGWDETADAPAPCPCPCHTTKPTNPTCPEHGDQA